MDQDFFLNASHNPLTPPLVHSALQQLLTDAVAHCNFAVRNRAPHPLSLSLYPLTAPPPPRPRPPSFPRTPTNHKAPFSVL